MARKTQAVGLSEDDSKLSKLTTHIHLRVAPELVRAVEARAKAARMKPSTYARRLLERALGFSMDDAP